MGAAALAIGALVFSVLPPFPAVRGSTPLDVMTPLHYQITVFLLFGITVAEIAWEWFSRPNWRSAASYFAQFAVVVGLSLLRLALFIPVSGHCLLLAYFLLRQAITFRGQYTFRLAAGLAIFVQVIIYKWFVWRDAVTPLTGFALGALAWAIGHATGAGRLLHSAQPVRAAGQPT